MLQKLSLLLGVIVFSQIGQAENCPETLYEPRPCFSEQVNTEVAIRDLTPHVMLKYCGQNPGKDYACRAIVIYYNDAGVFQQQIFEEWFIANPGLENETQYRSFMLKQENDGLYDAYWADNFVGEPKNKFKITSADPNQTNVNVGFQGWYPSYDFHYNFASGDKPPVRGLISYSADNCTIKKYNPESGGLIETLVYPLHSVIHL